MKRLIRVTAHVLLVEEREALAEHDDEAAELVEDDLKREYPNASIEIDEIAGA